MSSLFDLTGKVAVVTGSSKGIGRAIAERLAEHGARVMISSRKIDACEAVAAGIRDQGGEAAAHACHVGRKEDLQALVDATVSRWGQIDILVCNAAVNPYYGPSQDMSEEAWDKVMNANLKSLWLIGKMVIPQMAERRDGVVIFVSAGGAFIGSDVIGAYHISKSAEVALARNLAIEWGPQNVRVNCIAPGLIKTDFAKALWSNPKLLADRQRFTPLQRIGEPDEIAGAAVFLAGPAAGFMTGQTIIVDGGRLAGTISHDRAGG